MKTIKVSEATPIQLDWLVATCEGIELFPWPNGTLNIYRSVTDDYAIWEPHCRWEQGGPIIERERVSLIGFGLGEWFSANHNGDAPSYGPTPLIAAMRAFVSSKLGDVAEVLDELVQ